MIYDLVIIGAGPAGVAAAVYAARKKLKILFITEEFGGQSLVSADIQNWIGEEHISGADLAKKLENHVRAYSGTVEIKMPERAVEVRTTACHDEERACDFEVITEKNKYIGKSIIVASGARRRKLGIQGESKLEGRGVAYCSTCDAPLFSGKKVAVVGGGNAGLEAVQDLLSYAEEIYLLEYGDVIKGDPLTLEKVKGNPKLKQIILNAQPLEIAGDKFVTAIKYKDRKSGKEITLPINGVFVEIGSIPNSEVVKNLVEIDKWGQIIIDSKHASTSHPGIFAAGDVTDDPYKQNNLSAGDGVKAALAAYAYLLKRQKQSPAAEKYNTDSSMKVEKNN